MNRRSILTKTGKGLMEATGKTNSLSRDLRNILKEIDGKVSVSELSEKFDRMPEPRLLEALVSMEREGYVREFVGKRDEGQRTPAGRAPASQSSPAEGDDLDFTAFTPAKPSTKPNEDARLQAQAQEIARQAQATRAREEAAAKAKAELAARAKAEADLRARQAAAAKLAAPVFPPLVGNPADAQAKAQAEDLARARREADERQRKEADEKARREAEVRARLEIEQAVKREAEERARKEISEKNRREDEDKARREAEARARIDAEVRAKREAEERTRREMEERARREIEERMRREEAERLRREEQERARREADRQARIDAEAHARVEAELRAKREAEERARREEEEHRQQLLRKRAEEEERKHREQEAAEALERSLREEQEKAQREAEERAQREEEQRLEQEERARREEEEAEERQKEEKKRAKEEEKRAREEAKAQAKAAAKRRKAERSRERAGEEAWRGDEDALRDSGEQALSAGQVWAKRRPRNLAKQFAVMLLLILVVGVAVLPFVPLDTGPYEKAAEAWLDQPVKIGSVNLTLLPLPRLKFGKVVIGRDPQLKIAQVKASPEIASLLEDRISLRSLELDNATVPREFLPALLQDRGRKPPGIQRITAKGLKIDVPELGLPPLNLDASLAPDGALQSVSFSNAEGTLSVKLQPRGGRADIEISSGAFPLPIGAEPGFTEFLGKGTVTRSELALRTAEVRAFG